MCVCVRGGIETWFVFGNGELGKVWIWLAHVIAHGVWCRGNVFLGPCHFGDAGLSLDDGWDGMDDVMGGCVWEGKR